MDAKQVAAVVARRNDLYDTFRRHRMACIRCGWPEAYGGVCEIGRDLVYAHNEQNEILYAAFLDGSPVPPEELGAPREY